MQNIFDRRSVNFFDTQKEISEEKLQEIIDLAVTAPSAFNLQPWQIIAVRTSEAKAKLHALSNNQPKVLEAPVTLIIIGDKQGYAENNPTWKHLEGMMGDGVKNYIQAAAYLYGSTDERKANFAQSNAGLLAMSIMYAAKAQGVESHAMSGIDFEGIRKAFDLDDSKDVVMTIALGYFDETKELYPRAPRRGYKEVVTVV